MDHFPFRELRFSNSSFVILMEKIIAKNARKNTKTRHTNRASALYCICRKNGARE
jgi:hypothetical protein